MPFGSLVNFNASKKFSIFFKRNEFLFTIKGGETTVHFYFRPL